MLGQVKAEVREWIPGRDSIPEMLDLPMVQARRAPATGRVFFRPEPLVFSEAPKPAPSHTGWRVDESEK